MSIPIERLEELLQQKQKELSNSPGERRTMLEISDPLGGQVSLLKQLISEAKRPILDSKIPSETTRQEP